MFPFYLQVTTGYLVDTNDYLVVTTGYLIATTGYFWLPLITSAYFSLLLVPRFSNNEEKHHKRCYQRSCHCKSFEGENRGKNIFVCETHYSKD